MKVQPGLIPRILPLRTVPEKEVYLYALLREIDFDDSTCPYWEAAMWDYTPGDQDFFNAEINSIISTTNLNSSFIDLKSPAGAISPASQAYIGELRGLAKLRDDGVISVDEFEFKKKQLIGV